MQVKLGVLADFASLSREGKVNIMGIFDEINVAQFPAALPVFYIVVSFESRATEFENERMIEVALTDQDGGISLRLQQSVHVPRPPRPGTRATVHQILAIAGLPFPQAGDYEFVVSIDGQPDNHTIPLRVNAPTEGEG